MYPNGSGLWRKNKRLNPDGSYGVDLNRNYGPYAYWDAENGNSSTEYFYATYRGPEPFSEPETRAIRDFLKEHKIRTCLNYHSAGGYYIYPYGARDHETADSLLYRDYAKDMSFLIIIKQAGI